MFNQQQSSLFGNRQGGNFGNQQQQGGYQNFNQNQQGGMNQPQSNPFNQQQQNQIFNTNTNQGNPMWGNQQNQQTQGNQLFNTQGNQGNLLWNNQQNQGTQGTQLFSNQSNQQQQGNTIFTNQANQQQQQNQGIFGNQTNQGNMNFNNPTQNNPFQNTQMNQGNMSFNNPNQGIFNRNVNTNVPFQQQMFPNQQQQMMLLPTQSYQTQYRTPEEHLKNLNNQIIQCLDALKTSNTEFITIDNFNVYRNKKISEVQQIKQPLMILMNNMSELKKYIDQIKTDNQKLDIQAKNYCKNVQQKLNKYKQGLLHNVSINNMIQDVKEDIQMIDKQVQKVLKPMYNAAKGDQYTSFVFPDEFSINLSRKILDRMIQLNSKIDEIIYCNQNEEDSLSQEQCDAVYILQQLLTYYENVSAKVLDFASKYETLKKAKIDSIQRSDIDKKYIQEKVEKEVKQKISKDFECYDIIKQIESVVQKRERQMILNPDKKKQIIHRNI